MSPVTEHRNTTQPDQDPGVDVTAVQNDLLHHAVRAERQLHELESTMVELQSDRQSIQEDLDGNRTIIESVRADLRRTQAALGRFESGTYGRCGSCRQPISPLRLAAIPTAERCVDCA